MNSDVKEKIEEAYQIANYNGISGLAEIEKQWRQITSQSSLVCFYHRYEWYRAYMRNLEP
jgi:hypothetical protein